MASPVAPPPANARRPGPGVPPVRALVVGAVLALMFGSAWSISASSSARPETTAAPAPVGHGTGSEAELPASIPTLEPALGHASPTPGPGSAEPAVPTSEPAVVAATPGPTATQGVQVRTGMTAHYLWQSMADTIADLNLLRDAGMQYTRFDFSWANSETSKGTYQYFDKLDRVLDAVIARGLTYTITVLETPGWANGGRGKMAPPRNPEDYARFMGVLARHEADRPNMVWEIWNEANLPLFWTTGPNVGQYTAMLRAAYRAIKAADPDATVLVGGIAFNDLAFFDGIYRNGGGESFDGVAIHPYTLTRSPSDTATPRYSFKDSVPQFNGVLAAHGQAHKPIFITEMGWSTRDVSDRTRGRYLQEATEIARDWTNVPAMGVYTIRQTQFATFVLRTRTYAPTASWAAYAAVQR